MISENEKAKLRFELANANVQSIGRAQGRYATTLLTFICLVWAFSFIGGKEAVLRLEGLELTTNGLWSVTPFVTLVLVLGYIGTLTAFAPALIRLRQAEEALFGSQNMPLSAVDTHKNIIDYLAVLQLKPAGETRKPSDDSPEQWWRRLTHLILPAVFAAGWFTSFRAILGSQLLHSNWYALTFDSLFLFLRTAFCVRPVYRCYKRFRGAKSMSDAYN